MRQTHIGSMIVSTGEDTGGNYFSSEDGILSHSQIKYAPPMTANSN